MALSTLVGGGTDYSAQIRDSLDTADSNWHAIFMCSDGTYSNVKGNPILVVDLTRLSLAVTVGATGREPIRTDLITPDGRWLADADLKTLSGEIVVENYVLTGKVMVYPNYASLFE